MKLDYSVAATLAAVIENDIRAVAHMTDKLSSLANSLDPTSFKDLAGAAYLLHNIYNALENSFEQISRSFENRVTETARWHKELLVKMFLDIPGIRPAVLPPHHRKILNELRGFRHVFRHSYDFELDANKLQTVIRDFLPQQEALLNALGDFKSLILSDHQTS